MSNKTAEEAARERAVASVEPVIPMDAGTREDMESRYEVAFLAGHRWTKEQVIEFCRRRALECRPGKETGYPEGQSDAFGEVAAFLEGME